MQLKKIRIFFILARIGLLLNLIVGFFKVFRNFQNVTTLFLEETEHLIFDVWIYLNFISDIR